MNGSSEDSILAVRELGGMGDIIHTLPAVGSLRLSFPDARIVWVMARRWQALLEGNPNIANRQTGRLAAASDLEPLALHRLLLY